MKCIIAGGRNFSDWKFLYRKMDHLMKNVTEEITVICGTARGADTWGERWAQKNGHKVIRMPANWNRFGNSAGYKRNLQMAKVADAAVIFWDGYSRGSGHMINIAKSRDLQVRVIRY